MLLKEFNEELDYGRPTVSRIIKMLENVKECRIQEDKDITQILKDIEGLTTAYICLQEYAQLKKEKIKFLK